VFSLITVQLGNDIMVAVQAEMADPQRPSRRHRAHQRTEAALKAAFPEVNGSSSSRTTRPERAPAGSPRRALLLRCWRWAGAGRRAPACRTIRSKNSALSDPRRCCGSCRR
jgi:hypothetical protein